MSKWPLSFCLDREPARVPRLVIPEELFVNIATAAGAELNRGLRFLQDVASGRNLKQFLIVCLRPYLFSLFFFSCGLSHHLNSEHALASVLVFKSICLCFATILIAVTVNT